MPASEMILLKAEARKAGIEGYHTMSKDELKAVLASAKGKGSTPAKGKASANGVSPRKGKAKPSVAPAAKSTEQKPAPKRAAAKGKASRATTSTKRAPAKRAASASPKRGTAKVLKPRTPKRGESSHRATIDRSKIDWSIDAGIGARGGKREDVMRSLKRHKGNYDKVYEELEPNAKSYYPRKNKHDAQITLRWLINRIAYDYVMATAQHQPGVRKAYGTANDPVNEARRKERAAARKAAAAPKRSTAKRAPAKRAASRSVKPAQAKRGTGRKKAPAKRSTARRSR